MTAFERAGFGPEAEFSTSRALAYLPEVRILFEEMVPGRPALDLLLSDTSRERCDAAGRCAEWLAQFHATAPPLGHVTRVADALRRAREWRDRLARLDSALAGKCERLFRRLEEATPRALNTCAGHGSYTPEHVIMSGQRSAVIDFDEYDVAHPARDVAWFVVAVRRVALRRLGELHALDDLVRHFVRTYLAAARYRVADDLPFFLMVECLRCARRDLFKRVPPVRAWAEAMLDEGALEWW
jgi:aminoglycoside phosphotransferase (APT) family kinase protein